MGDIFWGWEGRIFQPSIATESGSLAVGKRSLCSLHASKSHAQSKFRATALNVRKGNSHSAKALTYLLRHWHRGFHKLGRSGHSTQASRPCCSSRHQGQDVDSGAVTQDRSRHGGRMELKKQGWDKGSVALKTDSSHVSPFSWLSKVGWGNRYQ